MSNKNKLISSTLLLTLLVGCKPVVSSSFNSSSSSSSFSSSLSSSVKKRSLEEMLSDIQVDNITYQSDYLIYYYELDNEENILPLKDYDVTAKITDEVYDMVAYEGDTVVSYSHLEKDKDGYVTYSDVNIKNELVVNRAVDGNNENFLWEESVYYNLVNYLDVEDFVRLNDGNYDYRGNLNGLPLSIVHTAIPVSTFNIEYFQINVEDNKISSFFFQEYESDDVYEGCMYGRNLTIYFKDVDCTEIEKIKPYEDKKDNDALGLALSELRGSNNYTIKSMAYYEDGQIRDLYDTYVTEKDIIQTQYSNQGIYQMGCHTVDNTLYIFETVDGYLYGQKAQSGVSVDMFLPTFDFSEDVFEFIGEEEGYRVYKPYDNMVLVLDYIDVLLEHSGEYYSPSGDVLFYVLDNHLAKVEFPVFTYTQADAIIAIQQITYSSLGSTTIKSSAWDKFVTKLPDQEDADSWDHSNYNVKVKNTSREMTLGKLFEVCLGSKTYVPYFISEGMKVKASAEYSRSDKCVYVEINYSTRVSSTFREDMRELFLANGFKSELSDEIFEDFSKDDFYISFLIIDGEVIVNMTLPLGSILD